MATSFLPFCAHCEKQIVVPNTSILFCSEKCRRKDEAKPPPLPIGGSSCPSFSNNPYSMTPPLTPYDIPEPPIKNYVEPFSPTPPRSVPLDDYPSPYGSHPISIGNGWGHHRSRSEQTSPTDSQSGSPTNSSNLYMPPRRPGHMRTLTGGSAVSTLSTPGQNGTQPQYHINSQRPLPPLHDPHSFSSSPRSIDLVTPYLSTSQLGRPDSQSKPDGGYVEVLYEKKSTLPAPGQPGQGGSLKTLFNFEAIRGRPPMDRTHSYSKSWSRPQTASPSPERNVPIVRNKSAIALR